MQTILQSGLLQNLANALLNSFWQMGLLWLVAVLILKFVKLTSAQKFNLAFTAQVAGFVFFIYSLIDNFSAEKATAYITLNQSYYTNTISYYVQAIMPFAGMMYIFILMLKLAKMFVDYRSTQLLRTRNTKKVSAINRIFVKEMSSLFSIKKKVEIYFSSAINCPLTFGFLKPIILLPLAIINNLTKEQTEAIILHELAHIKRNDYLLYLVQCFIDKVFFFNVFSKMLSNIVERERENACDDWVIQFKYNTYHYAEALLKIGKLQTSASLAMAASGKTGNVLLLRIKRLLHNDENSFGYKTSFIVFNALTLFFVFALMFLSSFKQQILKNPPVTLKKVISNETINKPLAAFQFLNTAQKTKAPESVAKNNTVVSEISKQKKILKTFKEEKQVKDEGTSTQKIPYIINVKQLIDSINIAQNTFTTAVNTQINLDSNAVRQIISYNNFKRLEEMLALTGNTINITEDKKSANDYKKLITIETTDKNGNKHIYKVVVELYQ